MLKHYLKQSLNNLLKHKLLSLVNIMVLSITIAVILYLYSFLAFEDSFDNFHNGKIYRVTSKSKQENSVSEWASNLGFMGPTLKLEFPEVISYTNITPMPDDCTIEVDNKFYRENKVFFVDSSFFSFFSFKLLSGDKYRVLHKPGTVVVSQSTGRKYFNNQNPVGKVIKLKGKYSSNIYTVTGVFEDIPANSHLQCDIVISDLENHGDGFNYTSNHWVYVKVIDASSAKLIEKKTNEYIASIGSDETQGFSIKFQDLVKIHLYSNLTNEIRGVFNGSYVTFFSIFVIGLICLITAFFNFINSSLMRTIERANEIGIRKCLGAGFSDNIKLFFTEAFVQILGSFVIGIFLYFGFKNIVVSWLDISGASFKMFNLKFILILFFILFFITTLFGFIYAFVYSNVKSLNIMKQNRKIISNKLTFRSLPVIIQFIICILFLSFTLVVKKQSDYMENKDLGYEPENVVMLLQPHLSADLNLKDLMVQYDERILKNPIIQNVTRAVYNPGYEGGYGQWEMVSMSSDNEKLTPSTIPLNTVAYNYFDLYKISLLSGSFFDKEGKGDKIIVNETAVKYFGFSKPADIIGKYVFFYNDNTKREIIGVVEDMHQESLRNKIRPVIFKQAVESYGHAVTVRIVPKNFKKGIEFLKTEWYNVFPASEFSYEIVTKKIENQYKDQTTFIGWLTLFSFVTLVICVIGIIIVTIYSFKEREHEIAIRKVLGAGFFDLFMLSKGFLKILLFSLILGLVLSYSISLNWLKTFEYRIEIGAWFALIPFIIVFSVFALTLGYAVYKANSNNPVDALKYE